MPSVLLSRPPSRRAKARRLIVRNELSVLQIQKDEAARHLIKGGLCQAEAEAHVHILEAFNSRSHVVWWAVAICLQEMLGAYPWLAESPHGSAFGRPTTFGPSFSSISREVYLRVRWSPDPEANDATLVRAMGMKPEDLWNEPGVTQNDAMLLSLLRSGGCSGHLALRDVAMLATMAASDSRDLRNGAGSLFLELARIAASSKMTHLAVTSSLTFENPETVVSRWRSILDKHASLPVQVRETLLIAAGLVQTTWGHADEASPESPESCVSMTAMTQGNRACRSREATTAHVPSLFPSSDVPSEPDAEGSQRIPSDPTRGKKSKKSAKRHNKEMGFGKLAGKRLRTEELPGGGQLLRVIHSSPEPIEKGEPRQPEDHQQVDMMLAPASVVTAKIEFARPVVGRRLAFEYYRNQRGWLADSSKWNVLTMEETRRTLQHVTHEARVAMKSIDEGKRVLKATNRLRACLELILMALGSLSIKSVIEVQLATREEALRSKDVVSITPEGELIRRIPSVMGRYQPKPADAPFLQNVQDMMVIKLPDECLLVLLAWISARGLNGFQVATKLFPPREGNTKVLTRLCDTLGNRAGVHRLSARKIRDVLPLEMYRCTGDLTVAQFIAGSELHLSPVGGSYYTARLPDLQSLYDRYVARLGLTPAGPSDGSKDSDLVGSMLCIKDHVVRQLTSILGRGLNRSTSMIRPSAAMDSNSPKKIIDCHNRMVRYVGAMLEAALATRSAGTVGAITMQDMCLSSGIIVIAEKVTDEAHAVRRLVLSPLVVAQIRAFRAHLHTLASLDYLPKAVRDYAALALSGDGPLVAFATLTRGVLTYQRKSIRHLFPGHLFPGNAFRHRAATKLREQGVRGSFVAAFLGHIEIGQTFGIDSPTCPRDYDALLGGAVDRYLEADGWHLVRGLGQDAVADPPPGRLSRALENLELDVTRREKNREPDRSPAWYSRKKREAAAITAEVALLLEKSVPDFPVILGKPHIDGVSVETLRAKLAVNNPHDHDRLEWCFDELHRLMLAGERSEHWVCEDRRRIFRMFLEPSPVAAGMLAEHSKVLHLRRWYRDVIPKHVADSGDTNALLCAFLLGMILFDYVTDENELLAIVHGVAQARPSKKFGDALFIPLDFKDEVAPQVTQFTGMNAMLAARLRENPSPYPTDVKACFESWLSASLPADVVPARGRILPCLLLAARVSSRFELSGTLRALRNRTIRTVSLTPDRMAALVDEWPPSSAPIEEPKSEAQMMEKVPIADRSEGECREWRRRLSDILKPRTEHDAKKESQDEKVIGWDPFALIVKLEAFKQAVQTRSGILHLVACYAQRLLEFGTPYKPKLAPSSIYKYVSQVARHLAPYEPDQGLLNLEEEEFLLLYEAIAASANVTSEVEVRRCLWYFHMYLQDYCGAVHLDASEVLGGYADEGNVDANIVTDAEYASALDALTYEINDARRWGDQERQRYGRAARVTLVLMRRSGARLGEIMGRLASDLFLGDECSTLLIHKTKFGTLKSHSAIRAVEMHQGLTHAERKMLDEWLDEQEGKRGSTKRRDWPLFAKSRENPEPLSRSRMTSLLTKELRRATGSPNARPHWLRHTATCAELKELYQPIRDAEGCIVPGEAHAPRAGDVGSGIRQLCDQMDLRARRGHRRVATTLASYGHILPLALGQGSAWSRLELSDAQMAAICGITYAHLRKIRERLRVKTHPDYHLEMALLQRVAGPVERAAA